jgi:AcrR family transcriptional regulator
MSPHITNQRSRPRKAPRQARSVETVSVIIEAAARVLEHVGLGEFTTNAVAERAGVSIGSLYQYFPDRDSLIGALIVRETSALIVDAQTALILPTGREALSEVIRSAVRHQLRRPKLARWLDLEEARLPFDDDVQQTLGRLRAVLLDVLRRPDLRQSPEPELAAHDVLAIIRGMIDAAGERGESDQQGLAARVSRAVYGYLENVNYLDSYRQS